jgi:hypothetical protein
MISIARPVPSEFAPYYGRYIDLVPEGDLIQVLRDEGERTRRLLEPLSESAGMARYEPGKWSVKEVAGHMCDVERVFAYRALRFSRKDETPLPGFDENRWVEGADFGSRTLRSFVRELGVVREASIAFFENLEPGAWERSGIANEARMSVRALAYVIVGHDLHHRRILVDRYRI